jgi:hypothetical protein
VVRASHHPAATATCQLFTDGVRVTRMWREPAIISLATDTC